jgi:hypothetical protein
MPGKGFFIISRTSFITLRTASGVGDDFTRLGCHSLMLAAAADAAAAAVAPTPPAAAAAAAAGVAGAVRVVLLKQGESVM